MIPLQLVRRYAHNQQVAFEVADQEIVLHYALGLLNQAQLVGRDHRCPPTPPNVSAEASNRPERSNHSPTPTPTTTPRPPHTNFTPSSPRSVDPGSDGKTQDAVIRNIEVIGQAVKGVSEDTRALEPSAPWRQIAGMRDKVIHEYFGVDLTLVWEVVEQELPILRPQLEKLRVNCASQRILRIRKVAVPRLEAHARRGE